MPEKSTARRYKSRPFPLECVLDSEIASAFQAPAFGMIMSVAIHYWRNPFDLGALSSERLAFLARTMPNHLKPVERQIRGLLPGICQRLDQARDAIALHNAGLALMFEKGEATRRARRAEARAAKVNAPERTAPAKTWGARRAASDQRIAASGSAFTD